MNFRTISTRILFGTAFFLLLLKIWFPNFYLLKIKPNLIRGLPYNSFVTQEEFDLRVQKLFPPNTLDSEIKKELSKQGFEIKSVRGKKFASFEMHSIACILKFSVIWEVNDRNEIYNLRGHYGPSCL